MPIGRLGAPGELLLAQPIIHEVAQWRRDTAGYGDKQARAGRTLLSLQLFHTRFQRPASSCVFVIENAVLYLFVFVRDGLAPAEGFDQEIIVGLAIVSLAYAELEPRDHRAFQYFRISRVGRGEGLTEEHRPEVFSKRLRHSNAHSDLVPMPLEGPAQFRT